LTILKRELFKRGGFQVANSARDAAGSIDTCPRECDTVEDDFVSLKQLAVEIGMERSHARRYVLRSGLKPHKRRTPDSGGQLTLALTAEEAALVRLQRQNDGFLGSSRPVVKETGEFYVIQLVPELDPRRIKLGFADDVTARLAQHRTTAPTVILVRSWPCKRSWEGTAIDCLSAGCRLILNEVYECDDLPALIERADRFFALLPDPERKAELSNHSPLNT
jgi:hypothetical protein